MVRLVRTLWLLALLAAAAPAVASVQITMTVEGPRGPFATADYARPSAMTLNAVQLDLGPSSAAPLVDPKPVVVTRPIDALSWQFLGATASSDALRVVITVAQAPAQAQLQDPAHSQAPVDTGRRHRRVVILTGARVLWMHAGMEGTEEDRSGLGVETIAFTYAGIVVEDDGTKVFSSGG